MDVWEPDSDDAQVITTHLAEPEYPENEYLKVGVRTGEYKYLPVTKIDCVVADRKYLDIYMQEAQESYLIEATLRNFMLKYDGFVQVNRNAIVCVSQINKIVFRKRNSSTVVHAINSTVKPYSDSCYMIELKSGRKVKMSRKRGRALVTKRKTLTMREPTRHIEMCRACGQRIKKSPENQGINAQPVTQSPFIE